MRFLDSGGELLDVRHDPPLFVEWGEGDFKGGEKRLLESVASQRGTPGAIRFHPCKCRRQTKPQAHKFNVHATGDWLERRKLTRNVTIVELARDYSKSAAPCEKTAVNEITRADPE
jgi:hypothetical protein